jgi:hypothetical protein
MILTCSAPFAQSGKLGTGQRIVLAMGKAVTGRAVRATARAMLAAALPVVGAKCPAQEWRSFRFEAVVDFIEIEIRTAAPTQGKAIQRKCKLFGVAYAKRHGGRGSYAGTVFRIRLYDVKNFSALQSKIASIENEFPFPRPAVVTMIEVAFDGYLKQEVNDAHGDDLAMLTASIAYRVANPVSQNTRTYAGYRGSPQALSRFIEVLARQISQGRNVGIGNKRDDQYQHCCLKTVDRNERLPAELHRARFEIRLAGAGLPHQDIEAWRNFKFQKLARHISFRMGLQEATPFEHALANAAGDRASHKKTLKRRDGGGIRSYTCRQTSS